MYLAENPSPLPSIHPKPQHIHTRTTYYMLSHCLTNRHKCVAEINKNCSVVSSPSSRSASRKRWRNLPIRGHQLLCVCVCTCITKDHLGPFSGPPVTQGPQFFSALCDTDSCGWCTDVRNNYFRGKRRITIQSASYSVAYCYDNSVLYPRLRIWYLVGISVRGCGVVRVMIIGSHDQNLEAVYCSFRII